MERLGFAAYSIKSRESGGESKAFQNFALVHFNFNLMPLGP
jgi:hypothetical protein